jgi:hypothetical protein
MMRDDQMVLFCKRAACAGTVVVTTSIPQTCPVCHQPGRWTTFKPTGEPITPFHNSVEDAAWLRSQNISGDD